MEMGEVPVKSMSIPVSEIVRAAIGAGRELADLVEHRITRAGDDEIAEGAHVIEVELVHHLDETLTSGLVACGQGVEVALHLHRLAYVGAHDLEQRSIHDAAFGQRHDGNVDTLLVDLARIGPEAEAADIDHVAGGREQRHHASVLEGRRHHGEVVQVTGAHPGIVGDIDVALFHAGNGKLLQEETHRCGHGVHVTGGPGDRLGEHAAVEIEDSRGKITGLAHGVGEGRANERLRLLLDHSDQSVPHELVVNLRER
jgi:hypothetical protein